MKRTKLKQLRVGMDYTQEQIADVLRVSRAKYAKIENGQQDGEYNFWLKLQLSFGIPDSEMWDLMKRKED